MLWFGTQDGLNVYNGFDFTVYSHDLLDKSSISNSYVHVILEENDSLLWVGTDNGLNLFSTATQKFTNLFKEHLQIIIPNKRPTFTHLSNPKKNYTPPFGQCRGENLFIWFIIYSKKPC